ncbi:hypothetical protein NHG32_07045 [Aerococcaceae bacterium NML191219]|nr:hypothetical protein [Aerococcaceae bacterium NML191219]
MRDKLLILCTLFSALTLLAVFNLHQQVSDKELTPTYYTQAYTLSESKRKEVIDAKGSLVQVDVLRYGDDTKPFYKVVHCRAVDTASGEKVVECYIDEVER